jgi:hypothetical protein
MRMQRRLAALLWLVPLALCACTAQSATMPEPSYPPPSGYAQGPGGGYPSSQETVAVGAAPTVHYAETYPPEPLYESMTESPGGDYVWVDGYWHWNGYEWVWIGGDWVPEQIGYVYIEPYYDHDDGYYVYQPGHWKRREHVPHGVIVRDHRHGRPSTGHYPRPHRPHDPDYRVPIERGKHPPRHGAGPGPEDPGAAPRAPIVRDHRRDSMPGAGRGAPPPRSEPLPRHRGPDQAGPPTVPRHPPPDISSPPPRAIPSGRPAPRPGAPAPRTGPDFGGAPPRALPPQSGPPPRSVPGPRITPRYTPPAPRGGAGGPPPGGPPPRGLPPPRSAPAPRGLPPPRSAPAPRGAPPPRSAPAPRGAPPSRSAAAPRGAPPPRSAPAPQGGQRSAPAGAPPRRRN